MYISLTELLEDKVWLLKIEPFTFRVLVVRSPSISAMVLQVDWIGLLLRIGLVSGS